MANKASKALVQAVEQARENISSESKQPRFKKDIKPDEFYYSILRWMKEWYNEVPTYEVDSRTRSLWLQKVWQNEPYLAGVVNSVVSIDRNRGWKLVGGRNQVSRFSNILQNYYVTPSLYGWRNGIGVTSLAYYTSDIGSVLEIGRQGKDGPLRGLYHADQSRCKLLPGQKAGLRYFPSKSGERSQDWSPNDYIRLPSLPSTDEAFLGLGYGAISRCIDLSIIMVSLYQHTKEKLFARMPKGVLLLQNINEKQWKSIQDQKEAEMKASEKKWYAGVQVIATQGVDPPDAKLVAFSELPDGFDLQTFTDLMMYGYAMAFGYDPREFWPVSSGQLGTATETEAQHFKAVGKGAMEFPLAVQDALKRELPETLNFEFERRDQQGDLLEAQLHSALIENIVAMYGAAGGGGGAAPEETPTEEAPAEGAGEGEGEEELPPEFANLFQKREASDFSLGGAEMPEGSSLINRSEARHLLAEAKIIPPEWTEQEEDVVETDTEALRKRAPDMIEVQQAMSRFPNDDIVAYLYPYDRCVTLIRGIEHRPKTFAMPEPEVAEATKPKSTLQKLVDVLKGVPRDAMGA